MPLSIGDRLSPHEILALIGAGGMGEVYRARDTKLKRDIALKILRDAFANDPERMARCQREAEVRASLNHPNIRRDLWARRPRYRYGTGGWPAGCEGVVKGLDFGFGEGPRAISTS